jgi:hypothetical protein
MFPFEPDHRVSTKRPSPSSRLWLLQPRADVLARPSHPWRPWFDKVFGVVVRAASEGEARAHAQEHAGHEGLGIYRKLGSGKEEIAVDVWLDPAYTLCEALSSDGPSGVILVDRREA